ncbi:Dihydrolipoamide acyltransferase [Giardia duodenalis]|uniref:Dihydrolipoamide acyltransferase n=1 Tax=Giardia intestinalis TaxID=5741 RepID=V6TG06_GIAIN|nr:Dihydrolipoamide acyltransferase [Giardia intestinalis]
MNPPPGPDDNDREGAKTGHTIEWNPNQKRKPR